MIPARVAAVRRLGLTQELEAVTRRINAGWCSYADVQTLAGLVGRRSGTELQKLLTGQEGREAILRAVEEVLPGMMRDNHVILTELSAQVQEQLNKKAGIGLRAARPKYNPGRADGILTELQELESAEEIAQKAPVIAQQMENAARSVVDDAVRANVSLHHRAGLRPRVTRTAESGCCQWCRELAGSYNYPEDVPEDLYRRHTNCNCVVLYDPGNGARRQDVWSKREVPDPSERIRQAETMAQERREAARQRRALYVKLKAGR